MIVSRNFSEVADNDLRALVHCAQFFVEQTTGRALYRDGTIPKPSHSTIGAAIRAIEAVRKELK